MDYSSYVKFSTQHDENIHALPTSTGGKPNGVCYVLLCLSQFFELVVFLCAPMQHDECCFFPSNN